MRIQVWGVGCDRLARVLLPNAEGVLDAPDGEVLEEVLALGAHPFRRLQQLEERGIVSPSLRSIHSNSIGRFTMVLEELL